MKEKAKQLQLILLIKRRWWLLVIAALGCSAVLLAYTKIANVPLYTATSQVMAEKTKQSEMDNIAKGKAIMPTLVDISKSDPVIEDAQGNLDRISNADVTVDYIKSNTVVINNLNSNLISITTTASSPALAAEMANAVSNSLVHVTKTEMKLNGIAVWSKAESALRKEVISTKLIILSGIICGVLIVVFVEAIIQLLNPKVKDAQSIESDFNIDVYAVIPKG
ncbi:YveK family protein [Weissella cibaria]|uniref:YveK family protein n=1 Tax=Weissella cibaria TaxID=137591 RepID=UPI000BFF7DCC|nr:hypothetical protein [Weissella cibaria]